MDTAAVSRTAARLILALAALAVLALDIILAHGVWNGVSWGMIYEANSDRLILVSHGAAETAGLRAGQTVTAIGLQPPGHSFAAIGDLAPVSVRQGALIGVRWMIAPPSGLSWSAALALLTAAALWLAGAGMGIAGPVGAEGRRFALFALAVSLALCCAAAQDPVVQPAPWLLAPAAFGALIAYLWLQHALAPHLDQRIAGNDESSHGMAPAYHVSMVVPPVPALPAGPAAQTAIAPITAIAAKRNLAEAALSGQAVLLVVLLLFGPRLLGTGIGAPLAILAGLEMPLLLLAAHLLPARRLREDTPAPARRRMRLALLVGLAAWLPALVLGWLPPMAGLLGAGYVPPLPPTLGALGLLAPAVAYPAIVARGDLFALELIVRRVAVSLVTAGALLAVILAVLHGVDVWLRPGAQTRLAALAILAAAALPTFEPLRRTLQGALDRRLATDEIDYSRGLEAISDDLLGALDEEAIAAVLLDVAPPLLGVTHLQHCLLGADGQWHAFGEARGAPTQALIPTLAAHIEDMGGATAPVRPRVPAVTDLFLMLLDADQPFVPPRGAVPPGIAYCVPVHLGETLRGVLLLGPRRSGDPYRGAERDALVLLARQVAASLQLVDRVTELRARNADLAQLGSRLARAREEERTRLSRELHDGVAQDLITITRQMRRHGQGALPDAIREDLIAQAQEALTAIRRICNDLRPAILDMGLVPALHDLLDRLPTPPRIQLVLTGGEGRLDEEREFALYRVVQEALANVVKHAEATEVVISIHFEPGRTRVEVRDNGRGFTVPARLEEIGGDHLGLLGMRERLADLDGTLALSAAPGAGACVRAELPA